jgi:TolB protein
MKPIFPSLVLAFVAAPAAATEPVTLNPISEAYPTVSPDGKRIVFQSTRLGRRALFMADADGGNLRLFLDTKSNPVSAVWSPDGRRIAFSDDVEGDPEIFIVDVDGRNLRRLTSVKADDSHPAWSHDGQRIFFSSNRHTPDQSAPSGRQWNDTFSIRPDGSDLRQHTNCKAVCTYPAPSPDGKRIAYRRLIASPGLQWGMNVMPLNSEVVVSNLDGSNEINLSNSTAYDGWPAWSPDGRWIAFSSNRAGPANTGQVFLVSPDGGEVRQLTTGRWSNTTPRWSPDSKQIYVYKHLDFVEFEVGNIGRVDVPQ